MIHAILAILASPVAAPALPPVVSAPQAFQEQGRIGRGVFSARRRGGALRRADSAEGQQPLPAGSQIIRYGTAAEQRILLWNAPATQLASVNGRRPPLAVFIHGGGWAHGTPEMVADKPAWFAAHGWAFASIGYRLLPESPVEEQAADVGRALARLRRDAAANGYDPNRILLLGHSAGAHLAALVGTDPHYAGDAFSAIRGVIPIDGACYDVVRQMADGGQFMMQRTYIPAFGTAEPRQRALSPTTHAGGADAPDWLLLFDDQRDDAVSQSALLATALQRSGAAVAQQGIHFDDRMTMQRHRRVNTEFGTPTYTANPAIEAIMRRVEAAR
jgi:acetyl esterase/lipase